MKKYRHKSYNFLQTTTFWALVFGGIVALNIYLVSDYGLFDWQFWAADISVLVSGALLVSAVENNKK